MHARMANSWKRCGGGQNCQKGRQSIRDTVHTLLSLLSECGVPKIPSECFRQAKFNQQDATRDLWRLLFHTMQLLLFLDSDISGVGVDNVTYHSITPSSLPLSCTIVKRYLHTLGYERQEFYVPNAGSRELLLGFVWLLNRTEAFVKLGKHFTALATNACTPLRATSHQLLDQVLEDSRMMRCELEEVMRSVQRAADDPSTPLSMCVGAIHKLVWLRGRLECKWRTVQGLCLAYQRLADRIHRSTYTKPRRQASGRGHLSTHEVFLLRYPNQMKTQLSKLGHQVSVLQKIMEWQECEHIFWQWMESVLDLEEKEKEERELCEETQAEIGLESVEVLLGKAHRLQEEFEDLVKRKRPLIDRVEQVWRHKSRMLPHKDLNGMLRCIQAQLRFEYPITPVSGHQTELVASMVVQQASAIDQPVYVPAVGHVGKQGRHLPHLSAQLQQQQELEERLVAGLRENLARVTHRIGELEAVVEERRAGISECLGALEGKMPHSVCKISNVV